MSSKIRSFKAVLLVTALLVTTIMSGLCPIPAFAALTSDFDQLNQAQIVAAMGAGWNLGNQLEANINGTPTETGWSNPMVTQALITKIKSLGFKSIRIPVSYLSKIGPAPNYTVDAAWLARIKEVVDYAYSQGLYVMINMHGDGYPTVMGSWLLVTATDQTTIKAKYKAVWQQVANTFKDYDEHLIFESMNEEFDGDWDTPKLSDYANLNAYNQIFVDTVRQTGGNNTARWLLIPGWNTNIDFTAGDYGFVMPTDTNRSSTIPANERRIMMSAHYYSPWDFCGDTSSSITQWGATATNASKKSTWGQEDYMEAQLGMMFDVFVKDGYPVVMGEFGTVDKTSSDSTNGTYRAIFNKTFCKLCKQYGAVPVYWDNGYNGSGGMAILDRNTLAVTQQGMLDAIMAGINTVVTPTSTPTPVPTPTPTPTGNPGSIEVLYKCNSTSASTNAVAFSIQVVNNYTGTENLANAKVRYWLIPKGAMSYSVDYSALGASNITGTFGEGYFELGFTSTAGTLAPGQSTGEIQLRLYKSDYSNFDQSNDYSFAPTITSYADNTKMSGSYIWGMQFGSQPTITPTPTPRATSTAQPTPTPDSIGTPTPSTATGTPTPTPSTATGTPTPTPSTATATPTPTPSTATATPTPTPSTATATPTPTPSTATATPTPTPSTATATPTPTPSTATATPTPTPTAGTPTPGGIKVQFYNGNTAATTNTIYPSFKVVNTGTAALNLSDVKARYYFTNDGTQANSFSCDYSTVGSGNVTGAFTTIAKTNADRYLEVGFTSGAGTLAVGASAEVYIRIWKSDWSNFTQTNDYSFNATASSFVDATTVTGWLAGTLKWGTEP